MNIDDVGAAGTIALLVLIPFAIGVWVGTLWIQEEARDCLNVEIVDIRKCSKVQGWNNRDRGAIDVKKK
jgi:hypothetical protein